MPLFLLDIDWGNVINTGITPIIILVVIGVIVKKAVWPRVAQYLDDARNERIEAQRILRERAESLEKRETTQLAGFTNALQGLQQALEISGRRQETQISMMEETLKTVKDTNEITRKKS